VGTLNTAQSNPIFRNNFIADWLGVFALCRPNITDLLQREHSKILARIGYTVVNTWLMPVTLLCDVRVNNRRVTGCRQKHAAMDGFLATA